MVCDVSGLVIAEYFFGAFRAGFALPAAACLFARILCLGLRQEAVHLAAIDVSARRFGPVRPPFALVDGAVERLHARFVDRDRKSTRLNSSHQIISYAVFCFNKKKD